MITSPTALELIDAVIGFIEQRAAPQLKDPQVLAHLKASIIDQVKIDQPNYSGLRALSR